MNTIKNLDFILPYLDEYGLLYYTSKNTRLDLQNPFKWHMVHYLKLRKFNLNTIPIQHLKIDTLELDLDMLDFSKVPDKGKEIIKNIISKVKTLIIPEFTHYNKFFMDECKYSSVQSLKLIDYDIYEGTNIVISQNPENTILEPLNTSNTNALYLSVSDLIPYNFINKIIQDSGKIEELYIKTSIDYQSSQKVYLTIEDIPFLKKLYITNHVCTIKNLKNLEYLYLMSCVDLGEMFDDYTTGEINDCNKLQTLEIRHNMSNYKIDHNNINILKLIISDYYDYDGTRLENDKMHLFDNPLYFDPDNFQKVINLDLIYGDNNETGNLFINEISDFYSRIRKLESLQNINVYIPFNYNYIVYILQKLPSDKNIIMYNKNYDNNYSIHTLSPIAVKEINQRYPRVKLIF